MPRRRRTPHAVASFDSTFDAMGAEAACREAGVPGRLIPTPVAISAECGLAWAMPLEAADDFKRAAEGAFAYAALTTVDL